MVHEPTGETNHTEAPRREPQPAPLLGQRQPDGNLQVDGDHGEPVPGGVCTEAVGRWHASAGLVLQDGVRVLDGPAALSLPADDRVAFAFAVGDDGVVLPRLDGLVEEVALLWAPDRQIAVRPVALLGGGVVGYVDDLGPLPGAGAVPRAPPASACATPLSRRRDHGHGFTRIARNTRI